LTGDNHINALPLSRERRGRLELIGQVVGAARRLQRLLGCPCRLFGFDFRFDSANRFVCRQVQFREFLDGQPTNPSRERRLRI
jgi:hypothetical protein